MNKRVTLKDISQATGLHFTTVSLALRGSPNIRPATRAKIESAAKKLGYEPDPMLQALSAYRSSLRAPAFQAVLGWINNLPERFNRENRALNEYREGAEARARQLGYQLEDFWTADPGLRGKRLAQVLRARSIAGLLIAPQSRARATFAFPWEHFSAVAFGYSLINPQLHVVTNHQYRTMRRILAEIRALGYRRVGLWLYRDHDRRVNDSWSAGFWVDRRETASRDQVEPYFYEEVEPAQEQQFAVWLKAEKPQVVLTGDRRVSDWLGKLGYRIPRDIGVCMLSVNRDEVHQSGAHENNARIGAAAVDLLVSMLHRGERGVPEAPQWVLIESEWRPGKTLRPLPPG